MKTEDITLSGAGSAYWATLCGRSVILPVSTDAAAGRIKSHLQTQNLRLMARVVESERHRETLAAEICTFFIEVFTLTYRSSHKLFEYRPLAKLARAAVGHMREAGPDHPGSGLIFETELIADLVMGDCLTAMRRTVGPVPEDCADLSWGVAELKLPHLMREVFPLLILDAAYEKFARNERNGFGISRKSASRWVAIAEAAAPVMRNARRDGKRFLCLSAYLRTLGQRLADETAPWADELLYGRFAEAFAAHLRVVLETGDHESRLIMQCLTSTACPPAPAVIRVLWEIIHAESRATGGDAPQGDLDLLWSAASELVEFAGPGDAFAGCDPAEVAQWPGGAEAVEAQRLTRLSDAALLDEVEARLPEYEARLAANPADATAGWAALCAALVGVRAHRGETELRENDPLDRRIGRIVAALFGKPGSWERSPWGAAAALLSCCAVPFEDLEVEDDMLACADLICRRLAPAARCGHRSECAQAASRLLIQKKAPQWVLDRNWERLYDVLLLDEEADADGSTLRASLLNCARAELVARYVVENGPEALLRSGRLSGDAAVSVLRWEDLDDADIPAEIRRVEARFAVLAHFLVFKDMEDVYVWEALGREKGTGFPRRVVNRLAQDPAELVKYLEKWRDECAQAWRRAVETGELSSRTLPFACGSEDDGAVDAEDMDDAEEVTGLDLIRESRAGILQNYGDLVKLDLRFENPALDDMILFVRPKAHPERLVCFSLVTLPLVDAWHDMGRAPRLPRFVLMVELPATLLDSEQGRRDLKKLALATVHWANTLVRDEGEGSFVENSCVILHGPLLAIWRPFPCTSIHAMSHVPFGSGAAAQGDDPEWVVHDGRRIAHVVEARLLTEMEVQWIPRAASIGMAGQLDWEKLQLREENRPGAIDIYSYKGMDESRTLSVRLPKHLRGATCWAARGIMEGRCRCFGFENRGSMDGSDSGWIFVGVDGDFTDFVRLPLADVLNIVPEAAPHVLAGRGTVFREAADGAGYEDVTALSHWDAEEGEEDASMEDLTGGGSAQA